MTLDELRSGLDLFSSPYEDRESARDDLRCADRAVELLAPIASAAPASPVWDLLRAAVAQRNAALARFNRLHVRLDVEPVPGPGLA